MFKNPFWLAMTLGLSAACSGTQGEAPPAQEPVATAPATTPPAAAASAVSSGADSNVQAATSAAQSWLALVDEAKYPDSWNAAAKLFQEHVAEATFASSVSGARQPLGHVVSRQLKSAEYRTVVPGAPPGKYVIIQFATVFDNKPEAVETVTPVQEDDGAWKVSGYFIK